MESKLPVEMLKPHPKNAEFFPGKPRNWPEILEDIKRHGVETPLEVAPDYTILRGHLRWEAARELGISEVPVRICNMAPDSEEALAFMIRDNVYRRHLSDAELASLVRKLKEFKGVTRGGDRRSAAVRRLGEEDGDLSFENTEPESRQTERAASTVLEEIARLLGISKRHVCRLDNVNNLIPELKELFITGKFRAVTVASIIGRMTPEEQRQVFEALGEEGLQGLTAREAEELKRTLRRVAAEKEAAEREIASLQKRLEKAEEKARQLESEVEFFRDRMASLEEDMARQIGEKYEERLRSELSRVEERMREAQEKLDEARAETQEYRDRLCELQQKLQELQSNPVERVIYRPDPTLEKALEEQRRRIAELEAELAETRERLLQAESPEHVKRLREEAEELAKRIESLKTQEKVYDWSVERKRGPAAFLNVARQLLGPLQRKEEEFALLARQTRVAGLHVQEFRQYRAVLARYLAYVDELLGIQDGVEAIDVEGRVVG